MAGNLFVGTLLGKINHDEDLGCKLGSFTHSLASEAKPPGHDPMNPHNFLAELKRRNVYKVAISYAVVGWLGIQIATQVFPFFEIPNWAIRLAVLAIVIGFPIALVIAWAFERTPEGLKRTEDVGLAVARQQPRDRAWIFVVIIAGAMSVGLFFLGRITAPSKQKGVNEVSPK